MMSFFKKFRDYIVHSKIFMQRTLSYIALINSAMILFLVLSRFQEYGINIYITKWIMPIYIILIIVMIILGYIEDRMGFHREETKISAQRNPYFDEIIQRLDKIEKRLKK